MGKAGVDPAATWRPPSWALLSIPLLSLQTSEQEEALFQDLEAEGCLGPPLHMSEELRRSVFISV